MSEMSGDTTLNWKKTVVLALKIFFESDFQYKYIQTK